MFTKTHTHTRSVTSNGFNRRQILKALGIGAAGLAGAGSLSGLLPRPARAGEGGTMTWGKPLETKEFDPHISFLGSSWQLQHLIYDSLTDMDDNLNPIPSLAESWEQASPTSYIFHLREGATFSNGRPMTADSMCHYLNYCTELLALVSKIGQLYVQDFSDATVLSAADQFENLATNLSRKTWQKIMILDRIIATNLAEKSAAEGQPLSSGGT